MHKRGKGRNNAGYTTKDIFSFYKKNIKPVRNIVGEKTRGNYDMKLKEFNNILENINEGIMGMIINDSFIFTMPYKLGKKRVVRRSKKLKLDEDGNLITRFLPINWKATNTLWERDKEAKQDKLLVYHTNLHSNGFRFGFKWQKVGARTNNISVICFKSSRTNARNLAKRILTTESGKLNYFD